MKKFWILGKDDFHLVSALPRIISLLSSLIIFFLGIHLLGVKEFANFQVILSVTALIVWISDLGALQTMIRKSQSSNSGIASLFSTKLLITAILLICYGTPKIHEYANIILIEFCIACDLITDTFMSFRQVNSQPRRNLKFQFGKRIF